MDERKPLAILAPMAGVTDWAYRTVAAEYGADVTVTEMVSSRALCYGDKKTIQLLRKNAGSLCGVQIFGNDPSMMAEAAGIALGHSSGDFVDINMGCPMPKIANSGDGSGLMRTPELAARIAEAVVRAVDVPVTVKMRKGWDRGSVNCVELARMLESAGVSALAVHGRTKVQMYTGRADWDIIREVRQAVSIPVAANGDVACAEDAERILRYTGADHVMVGRAAFGDPFLFQQIRAKLNGEPVPERPPLAKRFDVAVRQIELAAEDKGEHIACLEARKHLCWYLHGVPHAGPYKREIAQVSSLAEIRRIAGSIRQNLR